MTAMRDRVQDPPNQDLNKAKLVLELRQSGISDFDVINVMEKVPREFFVPSNFQNRAYENTALPIELGQTISQPGVVAHMTQALDLNKRAKVLEIGTGSGYQAVILSHLCRRVYTVERMRPLLKEAEKRFDALQRSNITTRFGDGHLGWPEQAPFDRIMVTAAAGEIPDALLDQLAIGGVLVAPVGETARPQDLVRIVRQDEETYSREELGTVRFVPLLTGTA